jgi:hypothetical protein
VGMHATIESSREKSSASARHTDRSPIVQSIQGPALIEEIWIHGGVKPSTVSGNLTVRESAVSVSLCGWAVGRRTVTPWVG